MGRRNLATLTTAIAATLAFAPGALAADGHPCGPATVTSWSGGNSVQQCPLTSPESGGRVPVYRDPVARAPGEALRQPDGWLHGTSGQYFVCQQQFPSAVVHHAGGWHNTWWAYTAADSGIAWGWVPQVYFAGGADNEPDAGLRHCNSAGQQQPDNDAEQEPNNDAQQDAGYRRVRCKSRWMTRASAQGSGARNVISMWPTRRARWATAATWAGIPSSPSKPTRAQRRIWNAIWHDLKKCLDFPDNAGFGLSAYQRSSDYQQLACHALWAVSRYIGGPTWDFEAWQRRISWKKILDPREVRKKEHGCNWDK